jgi:hypothetical protein
MRNVGNSRASNIRLNTRTVQQSTRTILNIERSFDAVFKDVQSEDPISRSERSRRAIRLPTRFR